MKYVRKLYVSLLALSMMVMLAGRTVCAAQEPQYAYTVRLFAGNQGVLSEPSDRSLRAPEGTEVQVIRENGKIDQIVISGVKYGESVYIYPQEAAKPIDERYYVRGVRRSGRDNSDAVQSTGPVASDMDYVIAYGISGDMVKYTVNYQDAAGNSLLASDTYYGNPGERQYVSARYIDGYQPQAYNLVMTLSANEAENVFNFQYTPVAAGTTGEGTAAGTAPADTAAGAGTGAAAGTAGAAAGAADAGAAAEDAGEAGVGGDAPVALPDEEVPQAGTPDDVVDLDDDEEVPLSGSLAGEQPGKVMSYLPIYIGIGAAALVALAAMAFYLKKIRRVPAGKTPKEMLEEVKNSMDDEL